MCEGSKIQLHFKIPSLKRKKVEIFITANEMEGGKMQQIVLIFHIFFYSCDELFLVKVKHHCQHSPPNADDIVVVVSMTRSFLVDVVVAVRGVVVVVVLRC